MDINDTVALIGAITGPIGLVVALLVYFKDRPVVKVTMKWDMLSLGDATTSEKKFCCVTIYNIGRRPIYLSHVHIKIPRKGAGDILFTGGISGVTLPEGAPPHLVYADQSQQEIRRHGNVWWRLRATVIDAAGKYYHSDWPTRAPQWAENTKPFFGALMWNKMRNLINRKLPW